MLLLVCLTHEQDTGSVENWTTIANIRVSARERANPVALFLVFGHCVGERLLKGGALVHCFKFLAKMTRDVFARTKF